MLTAIAIVLAVTAVLLLSFFFLLLSLGNCPEKEQDRNGEESYYDKEGNHLYYDRKLIARRKKERTTEENR